MSLINSFSTRNQAISRVANSFAPKVTDARVSCLASDSSLVAFHFREHALEVARPVGYLGLAMHVDKQPPSPTVARKSRTDAVGNTAFAHE